MAKKNVDGSYENGRSGSFLGKTTLILAFFLIILLVGAYFLGQYYFKNHFFPKTVINGVEVQFKTEQEAMDLINEHLSKYKLKIHSEEGDMTLSAEEVGLVYEQTEDLSSLLEGQDVENWITESFKDHNFQAMKTNLDNKMLKASIQTLDCMHPKHPEKSKRAKILFDKAVGEFLIQEATIGNEIELKPFTRAVKATILKGEDFFDLTCKKYYKQPKYTSKSKKVIKAKEKIDKYMGTVVHLKDGDHSMDITRKQIHNFIKVTNNYEVSLKTSEVEKFVRDDVWSVMNNDEDSMVIESPGSGTIYITSNYDDPKVVNIVDERIQLLEDIKAGKEVTRTPCYTAESEFLYSDYGYTIGDTYIDISIYDQTVWVIKDGKVVTSSPCVTGSVGSGHSSPTGIYSIKMKTTNYMSSKYKAFFNYWMPYDMANGIGLHDATWRGESEFGGDTYVYSGSHGCINLPYYNAQEIYGIIYVGYPVIVH